MSYYEDRTPYSDLGFGVQENFTNTSKVVSLTELQTRKEPQSSVSSERRPIPQDKECVQSMGTQHPVYKREQEMISEWLHE